MITRVVKMTFRPGTEPDFHAVFTASAPVIRSFEGCIEMNVFNDVAAPNVYFTISKWENEEALNNYRNSDFFKDVWAQTKALFANKAEAWSLSQVS